MAAGSQKDCSLNSRLGCTFELLATLSVEIETLNLLFLGRIDQSSLMERLLG